MHVRGLLANKHLSGWLLRIGLATIFLYAAISSFTNPDDWVAYLPNMLSQHFDPHFLLKFFSAYELLLAAWLLSGVYVRYAGLLCALTLVGIITSNFHLFAITFRDIALIFSSLALASLDEE